MAPAPIPLKVRLVIDVTLTRDPLSRKSLERILTTAHRQLREKLSEFGVEIETRFEESE